MTEFLLSGVRSSYKLLSAVYDILTSLTTRCQNMPISIIMHARHSHRHTPYMPAHHHQHATSPTPHRHTRSRLMGWDTHAPTPHRHASHSTLLAKHEIQTSHNMLITYGHAHPWACCCRRWTQTRYGHDRLASNRNQRAQHHCTGGRCCTALSSRAILVPLLGAASSRARCGRE